jgi:ribonuclease-3
MEQFETIINYEFKNKNLLTEALTHSSYANEDKANRKDNERLEFLGDSVLGMVIAEYLFSKRTDFPEGELTKVRASLVCENSLFEFAKKIDLGNYLRLGHGEVSAGGCKRPSILADAFEALIAAIFLDGGLDEAKTFIMQFIPKRITVNSSNKLKDYKSKLQEIIQRNHEEHLEYRLTAESGPAHNKTFEITVFVGSNEFGKGKAKTKKQAEQNAAKEALSLLGEKL